MTMKNPYLPGIGKGERIAWEEGHAAGAADERAAIVKFLRLPNMDLSLQQTHQILCLIGDAIESGAHTKAEWE